MHHAVNWFEIPVQNMARAQAFYEAMLGQPLRQGAWPATPSAGCACTTWT